MRRIAVLFLLLSAFSSTAAIRLPRVTVKGSSADDGRGAPGSTTVLDRDAIEKSGARSIPDLLENQPGIQIERFGGEGQMAAVRIRGSAPAQVLVLLDGIPLNPVTGGGADLNGIDPDRVESITIIRDGASARLGNGAFAGAILIRTRRSMKRGFSGSIAAHAGSWGLYGFSGTAAFVSGGGLLPTVRISGGHARSEGGYLFPGQTVQSPSGEYTLDGRAVQHRNTGFTTGDGEVRLSWFGSGGFPGFDLLFRYGFRDAGVPGTIDFPTVNASQTDTTITVAAETRLTGPGLFPGDNVFIRLFRHSRERHYADFSYYDSEERHIMERPGLLIRYTGSGKKAAARTSLAWARERLDSSALKTEGVLVRDNIALQSGLTFRPSDGVRLDGDMRADYHSRFGFRLSPEAGAGVTLRRRLTLHLKAGSSYRLPSFSDLFWPATFFAAGNPDLEPERSLNLETGAAWNPHRNLAMKAAAFYKNVRDLILWSPSAGGVWRPSNIGRARILGTELSALLRVQIGTFLLKSEAAYTLQFVTDTTGGINDGNQLPRVPHEKANISLSLISGFGWYIRTEGNYLGFRYINAANTKYLGDAFLINLAAGLTLKNGFYIKGGVRNLFDTFYIHVREYPVPGREYRLESGWRF